MSYFYGPVPSRRLGFSLGVDVTPHKTCTFNCVYCHVGKTTRQSSRRFQYINYAEFSRQLTAIVAARPRIDWITFSGSGEPTLHKDLDRIIAVIKKITHTAYPVCVITNSSLLYRADVRRQLRQADLIIPSLDALTQEQFEKINRPRGHMPVRRIIEGIEALRREYTGRIWLEVMLLKGVNDTACFARKLKALLPRLKPDKLQLNIPQRPHWGGAQVPSRAACERFVRIVGTCVEIIKPAVMRGIQRGGIDNQRIIEYVRRRPATVQDLVCAYGVSARTIEQALAGLARQKKITYCSQSGTAYIKAVNI